MAIMIRTFECSQCGKTVTLDGRSDEAREWLMGAIVRAIYWEQGARINRAVYVQDVSKGLEAGMFCSAVCEEEWARERLPK